MLNFEDRKFWHKHLEFVLSSVHSKYLVNVTDIKTVFHFDFLFLLTLFLPSEGTVTGTYDLVIIKNLRSLSWNFPIAMGIQEESNQPAS